MGDRLMGARLTGDRRKSTRLKPLVQDAIRAA